MIFAEELECDATALRRGDSRSRLQKCRRTLRDATALRRGVSRLVLSVTVLVLQQEA